MNTRNWVRELYTRRASFYERLFIDFLGWGKELRAFFQNSNYLYSDQKILDAGCGTGIATRVLYELADDMSVDRVTFHAFDLTWNMLEVFQRWVERRGASHIELRQADVLEIDNLPPHWKDYDLIVSSTMLEYLPKSRVKQALTNLRRLLKDGGRFLVLVTKRNLITRWLAEKWWKTNTFDGVEMQILFHEAGFDQISFKDFSPRWSNFILVIEAKK